ncbi:ProQ/FINO family protein [Enterobacter hormaechei]|uniref:ProQ/FINO family protein n=1 Tax=Enterobacter hormaechei TaxID=158836 RepID=UPI00287682AB|nr:ProQ/FINO family protein [Enterobacter hormaechei]MDR9909355.1 ProQ/FINO family protein [Enterobacter hormaechei subsp. steigerwaltii]
MMETKTRTLKKILVPGENGLVRPRTKARPAGKRPTKVKKLDLKDVRPHQRKLINHWPDMYRNGRILPVAVGIREAMVEDLKARGITINPKRIASELSSALNTENYQRRILFMKHRYGLDGKPVAEITDQEREYAYQKLAAKMTERGRTPPRPGFWKAKKAFRKKPKGQKPVKPASSS